jgi:hypothetical protein
MVFQAYPSLSRTFISLSLLAATVAIAVPTGAMAEDITDVILTKRSSNCADFAQSSTATATDVQRDTIFKATVSVTVRGATCVISSNAIPNHDFNARGRFANEVTEQNQDYTVTAAPKAAARPTPLALNYDNAVFLNGVKLDQLAAGCFGVGNGFIGCRDMDAPFRYDPLGEAGKFGTDEHNAHTQPDGTYHYHGNPLALFAQDHAHEPSPVIGFAADGFPIFGSFIADGGTIRKAQSSYQLKTGTRSGGPGGTYDGTFIDDWVYVEGSGDLDACNGMTQDGIYGYVVTDTYPHVMGCFTGTPDPSFRKGRP